MTHRYISTACHHERHSQCRVTCKFCPARCACTVCDHGAEHAGHEVKCGPDCTAPHDTALDLLASMEGDDE